MWPWFALNRGAVRLRVLWGLSSRGWNRPMSRPNLLGIEIGGTKLQVGLGRRDGTLVDLERLRVVPELGAGGILAQIEEATAALLARHGLNSTNLASVGVGFGGPVDSERRVVVVSNQIDGWTSFPLVEWVRSSLRVDRVALANDADTAALGEARAGAGVGVDPVLYLTIGSGVGGGLIANGSIYRGSGRGAVEIGHLIVDEGSDGSLRTLESVAAGWSIAREGRAFLGDASTAEQVVEAARAGRVEARRILSTAHRAMGQALASAITLLAPRRVILGGGVSLIGEADWFEPIRREVEARVFPPFRATYDIVPAALGESVVVHGALALAADAAVG